MPRLCSSLLLSLLIAWSASAVTIDWTPIGNPGNSCDLQPEGCFGAVSYSYSIGTYEVTNAQYAEFLNAKAASDPLELYSTGMNNTGIARTGSAGTYTYSVNTGQGDKPVVYVSFYDSVRFANWLHNGQGAGDTETGAYTLLGGRPFPIPGASVTRNVGATVVLTNQDEWYKAAYYSPETSTYYDYPAGSNTQTTCSAPTATANRANCSWIAGALTPVGSYNGSPSPYGTFDQGGNAWEWKDVLINGTRPHGGGAYGSSAYMLHDPIGLLLGSPNPDTGFRIAMIPGGYVPEPSTGLLVIAGLIGLAVRRRVRAAPPLRGLA